MFHIGHLNLLRSSRSMCDHLIVGVSTDELIKRMKKKSPVICFEERMQIVASVRYADTVVVQADVDKMAAWERYKFNLMFSGDDWKGTERWQGIEADLAKVGALVIYFPYTQHTSSSKLSQALDVLSAGDDY